MTSQTPLLRNEPLTEDGTARIDGDPPAQVVSGRPTNQAELPILDPWQTFVAPPFPLDTLPPVIRDFVRFQARNIGADPSAIAMGTLAACSGALDHRFALKMMEHGEWWAHPRLWVALIGSVSSKKTPLIRVCLEPIRTAQGKLAKRYRDDQAAWKAANAKAADKEEKPREPEPPVRYIANDVTVEKLADLLAHESQERGLLIEADELTAWLGSMEKYNGGKGAMADRGFWLKAYNGGPHQVDRISRGSSHLGNCSISLLGGIQPERLAGIGNLSSDGLLQRFLPVMMADAELAEDIPDDGAVAAYGALLTRLLAQRGCALVMHPDAREAASAFRAFLHVAERLDLGVGLSSFVGKLAGVHGSLSLILHLASGDPDASLGWVSKDTVMAAERIIREFVIPHATVLYQQSFDGADWDDLRALCSFILTSSKVRFTASDFTTNVRSLRGLDLARVSQRLSPLVAGGWLFEEPGNIPARAWTVVAGLRERLADRRETEKRRKAEALVAFHHPAHTSHA